jgi:hypothetical protein
MNPMVKKAQAAYAPQARAPPAGWWCATARRGLFDASALTKRYSQ